MPPKKKTEVEQATNFGRIGTHLKVGIVGVPNVGKSTFFNVLTKCQVPAENFPFCTIDPNSSRVPVPDTRFDFLCDFYKPPSTVPAFLQITDIAGLVKGAHVGQGLGNAFLSHISACDAIYHMLRVFEDDNVSHVEGDINPIRDMEIINDELRLKDIETLEKKISDIEKVALRNSDKTKSAIYDCLMQVKEMLVTEQKHIRFGKWSNVEIDILNEFLFLTAKPHIYLINMSEKHFARKKDKWLAPIKEFIDKHDPGAPIIPFSAENEMKLLSETPDGGATAPPIGSSLAKIIKTGFIRLNLLYFFTVGPDEVRAWTIHVGTKAPQAAGRIHTDFEEGFIMAEVMKYDEFKECGSEAIAKSEGKYRNQGKSYTVEDGDIIYFRFNAGAGLTKGKKP